MELDRRFWAFISYSHGDAQWADWLQRALESYRVPRRLVGRLTLAGAAPRQFKPIFRDREDLAANPDLRQSIGQVLAHSVFLIVICSPAAAASPWVEDEIIQFKRAHGEARVLPVIVAGEPFASGEPGREAEECFPRALRFHLDQAGEVGTAAAEPVAADLRSEGDGRRGAVLKLLAGMLGIGLDELIQRDAQRRTTQLWAVTATAVAAALAMGGLTMLAVAERNEAQRQQAKAEKLIAFMLGDLTEKLEPYGRLDALDAVGREVLSYYDDEAGRDLGDDAQGRRARALQLMGNLRERRGSLTGALDLFNQAFRATSALLARHPNDPEAVFDHAQSAYWLGEVADSRGQLAEAEARFKDYQRLADRLAVLDPANERSEAEVAYADTALGAVQLQANRPDRASSYFASALPIFEARAQRKPADSKRQYDLALGHAWLADTEVALHDLDGALRERMAERSIHVAILAAAPDDSRAAFSLAVNRKKVAAIYLALRKPGPARAELDQAAAAVARLTAAEPANADYRALADDVAALAGAARGGAAAAKVRSQPPA
jgi:hypothetical protein